jgi:hypothetical protein
MRRCEERLIEILLELPETAEERCALDALKMNDVQREALVEGYRSSGVFQAWKAASTSGSLPQRWMPF